MYVGPIGPKNARLAIVGEKPGRDEVHLGQPFVGPSGRELDGLLHKAGLARNSIYITNAVKNVDGFDNPTNKEIEAEQLSLYRELSSLPELNCIVPMGGVALAALSNFQYDKITKRRGSVLKSFLGTKMVPTLHPAFYMRGEWRYKSIVLFDLKRAIEESYDSEITLPRRTYNIEPKYNELKDIRAYFSDASNIAFDIELCAGRFISCIAFSKNGHESICIPFCSTSRQNYWPSADQEYEAWKTVQHILNHKGVRYITQNGLFDCWHLWRHGINTPHMNVGFDTMYAHKVRAPDLPHDLAFLVSIYTREPYYKDESGQWDSDIPVPNEQFWIYNSKDACCTYEVAKELRNEMQEHGLLEHYIREVQTQWESVMCMRINGFRVDTKQLQASRAYVLEQITIVNNRIKDQLGWIPNTRSKKDMRRLLEALQVKTIKTQTGHDKTDEDSLKQYAHTNPQHRGLFTDIISINENRTLASNFSNFELDEHDFYHPALFISGTKTGRLSSKGADGGGPQIQNIPKFTRRAFVPDNDESELSNYDLKQAETMVAAWLAQDRILIDTFKSGKDSHRVTACIIFKDWNKDYLPPDDMLAAITIVCPDCAQRGETECIHSQRYLAKRSRHAFMYKMGARKFCMVMRKSNLFIEESYAKQIRERILSPAILRWHEEVFSSLKQTPWLVTPLGRRREFYGYLDEDLVRQALSWLCQATVGQITANAMRKAHNRFQFLNPKPQLKTQTHDSLTVSHSTSMRKEVNKIMLDVFKQPIDIYGNELIIPIDISHGPSWGKQIEEKVI